MPKETKDVSVLLGLHLNPNTSKKSKNDILSDILKKNETTLSIACKDQSLTSQDIHKLSQAILLTTIATKKDVDTIPNKIIMLRSLYLNPNADEEIKKEITGILRLIGDPTTDETNDLKSIIQKFSGNYAEISLLNFYKNPDLEPQDWVQLLPAIESLKEPNKIFILLGLYLNPNTPEIYKKHIFKHANDFPINYLILDEENKLAEEIYKIKFKDEVSELLKLLQSEKNKDFSKYIQDLKIIFSSAIKFMKYQPDLIDLLFKDENYKEIINLINMHIASENEEKIKNLTR